MRAGLAWLCMGPIVRPWIDRGWLECISVVGDEVVFVYKVFGVFGLE